LLPVQGGIKAGVLPQKRGSRLGEKKGATEEHKTKNSKGGVGLRKTQKKGCRLARKPCSSESNEGVGGQECGKEDV